jgi:glycosyltransferase involved in cell wall biosynthesis
VQTDIPHDLMSEPFNILFLGQMIENKGPHLVVEAFTRICAIYPHARLIMAGEITDWSGHAWARELRDSTLNDDRIRSRVRFLGFVEDVPTLMARCRLTVTPTLTDEPLANVVLEAKNAGRPTIVFPSGGLPEIVEHGVDGYICREKTVEAIENALRYYLDEPGRSEREGAAAAASLERLGVARFDDCWNGIYDDA